VARARWFARRGYAVAVSDVRGRFDSEGDWDPFGARHKTEGYDLVEWVAKQPWCTGKVGMTGPSFMGWTQWWTATQGPPSLRAFVPEVAPPDAFANAPYQDGVLVGWMMGWAAIMSGRVTQTVGPGAYGGFTRPLVAELLLTERGVAGTPRMSEDDLVQPRRRDGSAASGLRTTGSSLIPVGPTSNPGTLSGGRTSAPGA
jgi:predicted acyl esterase